MESRTGLQISTRAFIQSLVILFVLMMVAGLLTRIVPAGRYDRLYVDGREVIDPTSYRVTPRPDYPIWRWFTAPIEVLGAPGNLTVIVIIIFILFIGGSFAVLDRSGIVRAAIGRIVRRFGQEKYALLLVISFFFMALGAFFGIFEEVVPLVPVMVALSYSLGWDALVGLGMSVLATNLGFSAAITNPFTIGVAQKLAQLPLFSGWWLRVPVFLIVYALFAAFLSTYARKIERDPTRSPVHQEDRAEREKYRVVQAGLGEDPRAWAARWPGSARSPSSSWPCCSSARSSPPFRITRCRWWACSSSSRASGRGCSPVRAAKPWGGRWWRAGRASRPAFP